MKPARPTLPDLCPCLEKLGDAAALIDRQRNTLRWTTSAFRALPAPLGAAKTLKELDGTIPGLASSLARDGETTLRLNGGTSQRWQAQVAALDADFWLVRITDRSEQSHLLQRQLDDREQLLFTSRTLSVGEMATTLAHELNQPIGACANLLRGLRSRFARRQALHDDESQALERAIDQAMFASRIITRIRQFTHAHQPRPERFELTTLLRECASLLDWDLRRSGTRLTLDLPVVPTRVSGDRTMLQQVFVNLMRNALDALRSAPPSDPHLQLRLVASPNEWVVEVVDNGCGLDESAEARLFVPFASSKPNGMGIGLSICRSFVELHQGRLWFSRNAAAGTTFHVGLPHAPTPEAAPARASNSDSSKVAV